MSFILMLYWYFKLVVILASKQIKKNNESGFVKFFMLKNYNEIVYIL